MFHLAACDCVFVQLPDLSFSDPVPCRSHRILRGIPVDSTTDVEARDRVMYQQLDTLLHGTSPDDLAALLATWYGVVIPAEHVASLGIEAMRTIALAIYENLG